MTRSGAWALSRLARVIVAAAAVAAVAQLLIAASPGSAAERAARAAGVLPADDSAIPGPLRRDLIERVGRAHGLDRGLGARIGANLAAMAIGDFGRSWRDGSPVSAALVRAGRRTFPLIALALALAIAAGVGLGALPLWARRREIDWSVGLATTLILITPPVWLALLLLRASGGGAPTVLAIVSLTSLPAVVIARHAREVLVESLASPWAIAARARGVGEGRLLAVYGLREVGAEIAPLAATATGYLLGAAMVVETVFGIRGLGALLADAAARGDAPIVVGVSVVCTVTVAASSVGFDAVRRLCDPRATR